MGAVEGNTKGSVQILGKIERDRYDTFWVVRLWLEGTSDQTTIEFYCSEDDDFVREVDMRKLAFARKLASQHSKRLARRGKQWLAEQAEERTNLEWTEALL